MHAASSGPADAQDDETTVLTQLGERGTQICNAVFILQRPHLHPGGDTFAAHGFMISTFLFLTTHRVLPDIQAAFHAKGVLADGVETAFDPTRLFLTSASVDFTLVCTSTQHDASAPER